MAYPPRRPAAFMWQALLLLTSLLTLLSRPTTAAFLTFDNCLDESVINSDPLRLQFIPLYFRAYFDLVDPTHNLNITVFGNVSGQAVQGDYPPADDPSWNDTDSRFGKITNTGNDGSKWSTLLWRSKLLTYTAYDSPGQRFCQSLLNGTDEYEGYECPLAPAFYANASDPLSLPAFTVQHDFDSDYSFGTLATTLRVLSGDANASTLACVSANITPDLGPRIKGLITWLPAVILILKGVATLTAAIWSPWGSMDIFRWSSNYGRDEDLLRLVTPGFGDCLQYIQFVTLTGALTLQYPGFFQPAVSQTAWSLLLFNDSFVSQENGYQSLVDGVYTTNGTYGLTRMSQLIGQTHVRDTWACMAVWLLVIAVAVVFVCQLGFFARWIYRKVTDTQEEDLQSKNLPFTAGNMIRLLFNFFILPIVAISMYQLVVAPRGPTSVVVMAVILLLVMIVSAGWILNVIFRTKPRTILFDDMPTVLLYGPLYNTYSDSAAPFALVPAFITFMRGVAIGAVQPSGIAQIIVLAICEVILVLTLNAFRPFQGQTSMNAWHTFFACVRLVAILLSIAFVPNLGVSEASKGWIGYAILLLHAFVLVFGFFAVSAYSIAEVVLRSFGVAGDAQQGAIRGSILNMRMLKKRKDRPNTGDRGSMTSNAAILQDSDAHGYAGTRSRSMSASSQQLLNQVAGRNQAPSEHRMSGFENFNSDSGRVGSPDETSGSGFPAYYPAKPSGGGKGDTAVTTETFYRAPRQRRPTGDLFPPGSKSRESGNPTDIPYQDSPASPGAEGSNENGTPAPAYFRDRGFSDADEDAGPRPDYAVREVDQYYRGGALSSMPTRKLKTGPADPEGPAANAQSWFQRLRFGGKKQQAKSSGGFEVVRSSRMLPGAGMQGQEGHELQTSPRMNDGEQQRYMDSPPMAQGAQTNAGAETDDSSAAPSSSDAERERNRDQDRFSFGFTDTTPNYRPASPNDTTLDYRPTSPHRTHSQRHQGYHGQGHSVDISTYPRDRNASPAFSSRSTSYSQYGSHNPEEEHDRQFASPRVHHVPSLEPLGDMGGDFDVPSRFGSRHTSRQQDEMQGYADRQGSGATGVGATAAHPMGRDWLRAVDELDWPADPDQRPGSGSGPGVPRKSSRRQPSADLRGEPAGYDYDALERERGGGGEERPTSFHVSKHKAGDSLTRNSLGAQAGMGERAAEFSE